MWKRAAIISIILTLQLMLTGCLRITTIFNVKTDGSGTIEQTVMMEKEMIEQLRQISQSFQSNTDGSDDDLSQEAEPGGFFDQNRLKEQAQTIGEGVAYVTSEGIKTEDYEGYRVIYSFLDINHVTYNQNPGDSVPSSQNAVEKKDIVTFQFTSGKPASLWIIPAVKHAASPLKPSSEIELTGSKMSEEELEQTKAILGGLKIITRIHVDGTIIQTNAKYRQDNTVSLMEMDFDELISRPEALKHFIAEKPQTMEEAKADLKDVPGFKIDTNDKLMIRFQ